MDAGLRYLAASLPEPAFNSNQGLVVSDLAIADFVTNASHNRLNGTQTYTQLQANI